jgi:hypothetical protein
MQFKHVRGYTLPPYTKDGDLAEIHLIISTLPTAFPVISHAAV